MVDMLYSFGSMMTLTLFKTGEELLDERRDGGRCLSLYRLLVVGVVVLMELIVVVDDATPEAIGLGVGVELLDHEFLYLREHLGIALLGDGPFTA